MDERIDRPQCGHKAHTAVYLINGSPYFCEDCRDDIGEEWKDVITVEEIDNDAEWED